MSVSKDEFGSDELSFFEILIGTNLFLEICSKDEKVRSIFTRSKKVKTNYFWELKICQKSQTNIIRMYVGLQQKLRSRSGPIFNKFDNHISKKVIVLTFSSLLFL